MEGFCSEIFKMCMARCVKYAVMNKMHLKVVFKNVGEYFLKISDEMIN